MARRTRTIWPVLALAAVAACTRGTTDGAPATATVVTTPPTALATTATPATTATTAPPASTTPTTAAPVTTVPASLLAPQPRSSR